MTNLKFMQLLLDNQKKMSTSHNQAKTFTFKNN